MGKTIKTFSEDSESYNLSRPVYPEALYEFLTELCKTRNRAWDSACGNGQVSQHLINYFNEIQATDISENQIKHAFKHEKINYTIQKSESTNFPDSYFDLICVAEAIHWFDIPAYYSEVRRTLNNDGIFACWGYNNLRTESSINAIVKDTIMKEIIPYASSKTKMLREKYETINFPFEKIETPQLEMDIYWDMKQFIDYIRTWSAFKLYAAENSDEIIYSLEEKLSLIWKSNEKKKVKMDFFIQVGRNDKN